MKVGSLIRADRFASVDFSREFKTATASNICYHIRYESIKMPACKPGRQAPSEGGLVDSTWLMRHGYSAQLSKF